MAWYYIEDGNHSTTWATALHDRKLHEVTVEENLNQTWNKCSAYLQVSNARTFIACVIKKNCCNKGFRLDVLSILRLSKKDWHQHKEVALTSMLQDFSLPWPPLSSHLWQFWLLVKDIFFISSSCWNTTEVETVDALRIQILPSIGWQIASNLSP